jgi:hypothetical protein
MSKEFEKLEALLDLSEPSDRDPQVDRNEAANSALDGGDWNVGLPTSAASVLRRHSRQAD